MTDVVLLGTSAEFAASTFGVPPLVMTQSYVLPAGTSNRVLLVEFMYQSEFGGTPGSEASAVVTYGGLPMDVQAMTIYEGSFPSDFPGVIGVATLSLDAATPIGTNIVITTGSSGATQMKARALVYDNVDPTDVDFSYGFNTGTSVLTTPVDVSPTQSPAVGDLVYSFIGAIRGTGLPFTPSSYTEFSPVNVGTFKLNTSGGRSIGCRSAYDFTVSGPQALTWQRDAGSGNRFGFFTCVMRQIASNVNAPNILGLDATAADADIIAALLIVGTVTTAFSSIVPAGLVMQQTPAGGASVAIGSAVDYVLSLGPATIVPNIVGQSPGTGAETLADAPLVLGTQTYLPSNDFPAGAIMQQQPAAGASALAGSAVNVFVSSGPPRVTIPDIVTLTAAAANIAIVLAGVSVGIAGFVVDSEKPIGTVATQELPAGLQVPAGTVLNYAINVFIPPFDIEDTVISQYMNSPTLLQLVRDMQQYIDPRTDLQTFYTFVWNIDTAQGFGLDYWGNIVGVSRLLQIPGADPIVGFDNPSFPEDWFPMSQGRFARESEVTTSYILPDDSYRILILTKALANIAATTAPALNQILRNLFPGRGRAYVRDLGNMAMQFVFNFRLSTIEYAILTQSGALPHPAGVFYSVVVVPGGLFGFQGQGDTVRPFNYGVFNSRPA